jgi:hypothetical protein
MINLERKVLNGILHDLLLVVGMFFWILYFLAISLIFLPFWICGKESRSSLKKFYRDRYKFLKIIWEETK